MVSLKASKKIITIKIIVLNTCTGNCWICCRCFRCVHTWLFIFCRNIFFFLSSLQYRIVQFLFFAPSKVLWADKPLLPSLRLPLLLLTQVLLLDTRLHFQQLLKPLRHVHEPRSIIHDFIVNKSLNNMINLI